MNVDDELERLSLDMRAFQLVARALAVYNTDRTPVCRAIASQKEAGRIPGKK